jgi:hypothetical protein
MVSAPILKTFLSLAIFCDLTLRASGRDGTRPSEPSSPDEEFELLSLHAHSEASSIVVETPLVAIAEVPISLPLFPVPKEPKTFRVRSERAEKFRSASGEAARAGLGSGTTEWPAGPSID